MKRYILIHYGELYLKGGNRKFFEDKLIANIRFALKELGSINLKHIAGRIIVEIFDEWDLDFVEIQLKKVFGLEYFTFAYESNQDIKILEKDLYSLIKDRSFETFRVSTRRVNKSFPLTSVEIDKQIGAMVVNKMGKKVNLNNPELNCHIDLIRQTAYIYLDKIKCRGGLPVGTAGKLTCLLSGGIDSPVAANLMQKRGAEIIFINFDAYPATPKENQQKVKDLTQVLSEYQRNAKLYIVPFLDIQKEIIKKVPDDYRVVFYRRMMLRISQAIAEKEGSLALVTGESLGQVASQTVENIRTISQSIDLPILRPCIGMNKDEITILAKEIDTYDISNQPFDDCCSLYIPKHPVTHSDLDLVLQTEKGWKYDKLLKKAIKNAEVFEIKKMS